MITAMTAPLKTVGTALVDAQAALLHCDLTSATGDEERAQVHTALVTLARTSCDLLSSWDEQSERTPPTTTTAAANRLAGWRGQFDEIRVQAALAEMEVRDASQEVRAAVEHNLSAVERTLTAAGREVDTAVTALRDEVRRVVHT